MVGINITGNLVLERAKVFGFVSLAKAVVLGMIDARNIEIKNFAKGELTVRGDLYVKSAQINGSFDLSDAVLSGMVSLENALIRKNLILKNISTKDNIFLRNSIVQEGTITDGVPPDKIIR